MAVNNPEAIRFSNERIRPVADRLAQVYYQAKEIRDEWYAKNLGAVIPVGGGTMEDGSETDGRHPIVADNVILMINRLEDLINDLEASNNAKLNTVLQVAVNTHA